MTLSYLYKEITETMKLIDNIDLYKQSTTVRMLNQQKLNKAYRKLDNVSAELEREFIKNKQKRNKN